MSEIVPVPTRYVCPEHGDTRDALMNYDFPERGMSGRLCLANGGQPPSPVTEKEYLAEQRAHLQHETMEGMREPFDDPERRTVVDAVLTNADRAGLAAPMVDDGTRPDDTDKEQTWIDGYIAGRNGTLAAIQASGPPVHSVAWGKNDSGRGSRPLPGIATDKNPRGRRRGLVRTSAGS